LARRGETHQLAGRALEATLDYSAAIGHDPVDAWALGSRGESHRLAGRPDDAMTDLTAALTLTPEYAWAFAERGEAHRSEERRVGQECEMKCRSRWSPEQAI
ncbi:tetratricopeptide repeat protein, partial [Streptomyces sp. BE20]|uniref:tetratricopeptide repeat protein n=1 Tax=Streptomyces sp. BE20 TaxID=3002525 RepID=UPI002E764468